VDEIHLCGDDRDGTSIRDGADTRAGGRELQRVGLSATVGNQRSCWTGWLPRAGEAAACRSLRNRLAARRGPAGLRRFARKRGRSDFAAAPGEKRWYHRQPRPGRAARPGAAAAGGTTFVPTAAQQEQRRQAEEAFAGRDDCVIFATSVLELGIDVGDWTRDPDRRQPRCRACCSGWAARAADKARSATAVLAPGTKPWCSGGPD